MLECANLIICAVLSCQTETTCGDGCLLVVTSAKCMHLCVDFTMLDEPRIMDSEDEFEILM